jgi:hypothetical protein
MGRGFTFSREVVARMTLLNFRSSGGGAASVFRAPPVKRREANVVGPMPSSGLTFPSTQSTNLWRQRALKRCLVNRRFDHRTACCGRVAVATRFVARRQLGQPVLRNANN